MYVGCAIPCGLVLGYKRSAAVSSELSPFSSREASALEGDNATGTINHPISVIVMLSETSPQVAQVEDTGGGSLAKGTRSSGVATSTLEGNISSRPSARQYKQQPCKYFLSKRDCPFGVRCRYLHANPRVDPEGGREDGRQTCRYFLSSGTCRYGSRCKYLYPSSHKLLTKHHSTEPEYDVSPPRKTSGELELHSSTHPQPLLDASSFPSMKEKGRQAVHVHGEYPCTLSHDSLTSRPAPFPRELGNKASHMICFHSQPPTHPHTQLVPLPTLLLLPPLTRPSSKDTALLSSHWMPSSRGRRQQSRTHRCHAPLPGKPTLPLN